MADAAERALAEARRSYEQNEMLRALRYLDRARKAFAKRGYVEGLEHVLEFAELVDAREERVAAERAYLVYAVKQNLRQATRKEALAAGREWTDPYPDLEAPRTHTRVYFSRGVKLAVAIGVVLGVAALGGCIAVVAVYSGSSVKLHIRNDLGRAVVVRRCAGDSCHSFETRHYLRVGESAEESLDADHDLESYVVTTRAGKRLGCLALEIKDVWSRMAADEDDVGVSVSDATPCPGTPFEPEILG